MGSQAGIILRTVVSVEESRCNRSRHDRGYKAGQPESVSDFSCADDQVQ